MRQTGEVEKTVQRVLSIPLFFDKADTLTVQLTSFTEHLWERSQIRVFRNATEIQQIIEDMAFNPVTLDPLRVADINGDGLPDIKIIAAFTGNGTAALNVRVIYLFQEKDHRFRKISFSDKMHAHRQERDVDGDGAFKIITMNLVAHEGHNYWLFNLFTFKDRDLVNANEKGDYPVMIQYLHRDNYEITTKISRKKMKTFSLPLPGEYASN